MSLLVYSVFDKMAAIATPVQIASKPSESNDELNNIFMYTLAINCINQTECPISLYGNIKEKINLETVIQHPECLHNLDACEYLQKIGWSHRGNKDKHWIPRSTWSSNFITPRTTEFFDVHFIQYEVMYKYNDIDYVFLIEILFMSAKKIELLIPSVIESDSQIKMILRNDNIIQSNSTNSYELFQIYCIDQMCTAIRRKTNEILDLRPLPISSKTKPFPYQINTINEIINHEKQPVLVPLHQGRLTSLGKYGYFNHDNNTIITSADIPQVRVLGGIIADDPGLGKTFTTLTAILSNPMPTLVVYPKHLRNHWEKQMKEHFEPGIFDGFVVLMSDEECNTASDTTLKEFQRLVIDEIADFYANKRSENTFLFKKLCSMENFQFRWGISGTPFVDNTSFVNIVRFLTGLNIRNSVIGNYKRIQKVILPFIRMTCKDSLSKDNLMGFSLSDIQINDCGLELSEYEKAIIDAMETDPTHNMEEKLKRLSNALLEIFRTQKSVVSLDEFVQATITRFQENINVAECSLSSYQEQHSNILAEIEKLNVPAILGNAKMITEYKERIRVLNTDIKIAEEILKRRQIVYDTYMEKIRILQSIFTDNTESSNDSMETLTQVHDGKACPICYNDFTPHSFIKFFSNCGHYICNTCFEICYNQNPNKCPYCREALLSPSNLVSIAKTAKTITSTKNLKIKSLLDDAKSERFIIFTRFDEFIDALVQYLKTLGISCMTLDDFYLSSKSEQDATRVILLSANTQASGVDLSFANNVIIIEPFDNYIYGKETEKQLIGRVHRIHQLHTVKVYRLFIRGTIEEKFYKQT